MTDLMDNDQRLRALDPLDADADLQPDGPTAHRVRISALAAAQRPGLAFHDPPAARAPRRGLRLGLTAAATAGLAAVVLATGLPGSGGGPAAPGDARAALLSAAERTAAFTSGHIIWQLSYDKVGPRPLDLQLSNDVRFEGADLDIAWASRTGVKGAPAEHRGGSRIVGGKAWSRYGKGPFRTSPDPSHGADAPAELLVRTQAADALVTAARTAADVRQTTVPGGTRFTATVAARDVPEQFRPPFKRSAKSVAIRATVGDDGSVRALALRAPGEAVDVTFSAMGQPQHIVAP